MNLTSFFAAAVLAALLFMPDLLVANASLSARAEVVLLKSGSDESILRFSLADFKPAQQRVKDGAMQITADNTVRIMDKGCPELNKMTVSLIIPEDAETACEIIKAEFKDYSDINIAPSSGPVYSTLKNSQNSTEKGAVYKRNGFYPSEIAELMQPHIFRNIHGQVVEFYPFQYNPVTKVLRVYSLIDIRVKNTGSSTNISKSAAKPLMVAGFKTIYDQLYLNSSATAGDKLTYGYNKEKMLIICHSAFMTTMNPFVEWKRKKGLDVELVNVSSISGGNTSTAIKNYISSYYNANPGLTYVLLVGDESQIASNTTSSAPVTGYPTSQDPGPYASDTPYYCLSGNDMYPEVIGARLSAETVAQAENQINKFMAYELNPPVSNRLNYGGVFSLEVGPQGTQVWDYMRQVKTALSAYTYGSNVTELYEGSHGDNGEPNATQISSVINNGVSYISWISHGLDNGLSSFNYYNSNVSSLTNTTWPMIWNVSCMTGKFNKGLTCFAETWMRAKNGSQLTGAIGTAMSTIMMQGGITEEIPVHAAKYLTGAYGDIYRTYGNITIAAYCKMLQNYASQGGNAEMKYMVIFGDPSLSVRTAVPSDLNINKPANLIPGQQYTVTVKNSSNAPVVNALVSLYQNGNPVSAFTNSSGTVNLSHSLASGTATLTVTSLNTKTYQYSIPVGSGDGTPSVTITSPADNASITLGSTVNISAEASDPAKSVTKVDFYIDNNLVSTDNSQPYVYSWNTTGVQAGSHIIKVIVTDSDNKTAQHIITVSVNSDPVVLIDQTTSASTENGVTSQDFSDYPTYSCMAADDFTVPVGYTWEITKIDVQGTYSSGGGPVAKASLKFYQNSGNQPGTALKELANVTVSDENNGKYSLVLPQEVVLAAGRYWVGVAAEMSFSPTGQWFWSRDKAGTNGELYWVNPGGGFNLGTTWKSTSELWSTMLDKNLSYKLTGWQISASAIENFNVSNSSTLLQNYPNPFNSQTVISYNLPAASKVKLTVYNNTGGVVACLVDGCQAAGSQNITFNAQHLAAGVYFYRLQTGSDSFVKSMLLLK